MLAACLRTQQAPLPRLQGTSRPARKQPQDAQHRADLWLEGASGLPLSPVAAALALRAEVESRCRSRGSLRASSPPPGSSGRCRPRLDGLEAPDAAPTLAPLAAGRGPASALLRWLAGRAAAAPQGAHRRLCRPAARCLGPGSAPCWPLPAGLCTSEHGLRLIWGLGDSRCRPAPAAGRRCGPESLGSRGGWPGRAPRHLPGTLRPQGSHAPGRCGSRAPPPTAGP